MLFLACAVAWLSPTRSVWAHGADSGLRGTCAIENVAGRADMVVEVENQAGTAMTDVTPGDLLASNIGSASIFLQTSPRPFRELLSGKSTTFRWKGRLFGDGFLDLSLEVTAQFEDGKVATTGIINCNRLAVGNPDLAGPAPTPTMARPPTARPTAVEAPATPTERVSNQRPTRTLRPTRTPRGAEALRPTRTPIVPRPTRTPIAERPTRTMRPTRTPIVPRPTRTPIAERATRTTRPTRTPFAPRPTRTPIAERATRTRIPTSTPRPTRTRPGVRPTQTPIGGSDPSGPLNESGFLATCSLRRTIDLVSITLFVANRTGSDLRSVTGGQLTLAPEGGSLFFDRTGPSPQTHTSVRNGAPVTFQWTGRLNDGGTMGFGASASGVLPDGRVVNTGPIDCGVASFENPSFDGEGFSGRCSISPGDATGRVTLEVTNTTGSALTDVEPFFNNMTSTGTAQVLSFRGPGPRSVRSLPSGQSVSFAWRGRILGGGDLSMQFDARGRRPTGERISTGEVSCGVTLNSPGGDLPDLTVDEADLRGSLQIESMDFAPDHCAVVEGCVDATGRRRLLRFNTTTPNRGPGDFFLGDPHGNPQMTLSECHGHFHFENWADYRLLDLQGNLVARGHKQAFCLVDLWQPPGLNGRSTPQFVDCGFQGISAGWADIYHRSLDCQWVDITGVPAGRYVLEVTVNPARVIPETSFANNVGRSEVFIPGDSGR